MNGLTDHELLLEIRDKLDKHIEKDNETHAELEREVYERPTRKEILAFLGGAGVLSGIIFGFVHLII